MKVLLSAYACEPAKSSEQGVGWNWALHLSPLCDLTVVTRTNNRSAIEKACRQNPDASRIRWIFHDLGSGSLAIKRWFKAHRLYYSAWQKSLVPILNDLFAREHFDVAHHITFASFRYFSAISTVPCPTIWGPVGGAEATPWNLLPWNHIPSLLHEVFRNLQTHRGKSVDHANTFTRILASTLETQKLLGRSGLESQLMPTIGIERVPEQPPNRKLSRKGLRLLFVGNLQHLKGIHFAIEALKFTPDDTELTVVGAGPYGGQLEKLAETLAVSNRVHFRGYISHVEIPSLHETHDVFIFLSLHDSGGIALLEAMASGLPSIVMACGGPMVLTDSTCGIQVPVAKHKSIVQGIAKAIQFYAANPVLRLEHGRSARDRVTRLFLWKNKANAMCELYQKVSAEK